MENKEINAESVYLYFDSSKRDIENFKQSCEIKYKFNWLALLLLLLGVVLMILSFISVYFFAGSLLFFLLALLAWHKTRDKRQYEFLDLFERYINKEFPNNLSPVYPICYKADNKNKKFSLIYQNKSYIDVDYKDIVSYDILSDRVSVGKRLRENPDPKSRSYIIEVTYSDNTKTEIGFSNDNKYFLLKGNYSFLQYANTKSVNKLATILDKIIKNGKV
ncbi:MAG: hypothetical protein ACI35W_03355 [Anaeroplasmataceae bacterium]